MSSLLSWSTELWVRVNPSSDLMTDYLTATVQTGLHGVYLPKPSSAGDVHKVSRLIERREEAHDLPIGFPEYPDSVGAALGVQEPSTRDDLIELITKEELGLGEVSGVEVVCTARSLCDILRACE